MARKKENKLDFAFGVTQGGNKVSRLRAGVMFLFFMFHPVCRDLLHWMTQLKS